MYTTWRNELEDMSYTSVDPQIQDWARRHSLYLFTSFEGRETRFAYVSSLMGECFQIWIQAPANGRVRTQALCIEGRREDEPPQEWLVDVADLETTLERIWQTVLSWIEPSNPLPKKT